MAHTRSYTFPYAMGTTFISKCATRLDERYNKAFFVFLFFLFLTVYVLPHYTAHMYGRGLQKLRTLTGVPICHQAGAIRIG